MSEVKTEFLTPVGRLVMGDCFRGKNTDAEGNPLVYKSGPNQGQAREEFFVGLAIPKNDPNVNALIATIKAAARQNFPTLHDAAGNCIQPKFAFKITDGDSPIPNTKNVRPCDREGFPGNWIFGLSSSFAPKCYTTGGASIITDPEAIKRGYFIRVYGAIKGNNSMQQPGVHLNLSMVEFIAFGEVISSGPDGATVFGGAAVGALPPGATHTPPAPTTTIAPPVAQAVAAPAPVAAAAPVTQAVVQPAPDFLNPAPVAAPVAPAPVAAPSRKFIAQGTAYTREQLIAAGWNDAQINSLPMDDSDLPF